MEYLKAPLSIKWYITNKCNLRCKFCYLTDYESSDLTFQEIELILKIIKDIDPFKISLLGGEPTESIHFEHILTELEKMKIYYTFSTNGQTLYKNKKLLNLLSKSKYLKEIQVSLESSNEIINDSMRGKGAYKNALLSIHALKDANLKIVLAMVLTKSNKDFLQQTLDLASHLKVDELRIIPFVPIGTGKSSNNLFLNSFEIKNIITKLNKTKDLTVSTYSMDDKDNSLGCGAGITSVVINSDLTLSACDLCTQQDKTAQSIKTKHDFCKIWNEDSIFSKWRVGEYRNYIKQNKCVLFRLEEEKLHDQKLEDNIMSE